METWSKVKYFQNIFRNLLKYEGKSQSSVKRAIFFACGALELQNSIENIDFLLDVGFFLPLQKC